MRWPQTKIVEGRTNLPEFVFEAIFQRFLARIWYSHPLKVLRKRLLKGSVGPPKYSFGEHNLVSLTVWVGQTHRLAIFMRSSWYHSSRQLVPCFSTISILNISTNVSTWISNTFVEMFKMEIVEKQGTSCRLLWYHHLVSSTDDGTKVSWTDTSSSCYLPLACTLLSTVDP